MLTSIGRRSTLSASGSAASMQQVLFSSVLRSGLRANTNRLGSVRQFTVVQNVPTMSDSAQNARIKEWRRNVGDTVNVNDVIAVMETDKAGVIDIRASTGGTIKKQYVSKGGSLEIGKPLVEFDEMSSGAGSNVNFQRGGSPWASWQSIPTPSPASGGEPTKGAAGGSAAGMSGSATASTSASATQTAFTGGADHKQGPETGREDVSRFSGVSQTPTATPASAGSARYDPEPTDMPYRPDKTVYPATSNFDTAGQSATASEFSTAPSSASGGLSGGQVMDATKVKSAERRAGGYKEDEDPTKVAMMDMDATAASGTNRAPGSQWGTASYGATGVHGGGAGPYGGSHASQQGPSTGFGGSGGHPSGTSMASTGSSSGFSPAATYGNTGSTAEQGSGSREMYTGATDEWSTMGNDAPNHTDSSHADTYGMHTGDESELSSGFGAGSGVHKEGTPQHSSTQQAATHYRNKSERAGGFTGGSQTAGFHTAGRGLAQGQEQQDQMEQGLKKNQKKKIEYPSSTVAGGIGGMHVGTESSGYAAGGRSEFSRPAQSDAQGKPPSQSYPSQFGGIGAGVGSGPHSLGGTSAGIGSQSQAAGTFASTTPRSPGAYGEEYGGGTQAQSSYGPGGIGTGSEFGTTASSKGDVPKSRAAPVKKSKASQRGESAVDAAGSARSEASRGYQDEFGMASHDLAANNLERTSDRAEDVAWPLKNEGGGHDDIAAKYASQQGDTANPSGQRTKAQKKMDAAVKKGKVDHRDASDVVEKKLSFDELEDDVWSELPPPRTAEAADRMDRERQQQAHDPTAGAGIASPPSPGFANNRAVEGGGKVRSV